MIGLLFLATVAAWLWACAWLSQKLGNLVPNPSWRRAVKVGIFIALLVAPFVDEVIGKYQFESLCKANGIESADVSKARGKKVKVEYGERRLLEGTIMPIKESDVLFKDADSGEVLIQHKNYYALGGWLMRYTWLSMGSDHPMLFGGFCDRRIEQEIFKTNSITFLYK
ncbi:MAG: hypothetical protein ACYCZ6_02340 [Polaromonas sp.]